MAGGDPAEYELDGIDLSGYISQGLPLPDRHLYWEMNGQTAVRRGRWKLVLDGQLVEGAPVEDDVHLSDMDQDMGERINLKDRYPDITAELSLAAQDWRQALETRWQREFMPAGS